MSISNVAAKNNISVQQMQAAWANAATKLEVNIWNFTLRATRTAHQIFDKSFDMGGFYTEPFVPWRPHSPRRSNPVLFESGTLRSSIKTSVEQRSTFCKGVVFSDPSEFAHAKRHPGFYYAKVHNAPDGTYIYSCGQPSLQRMFIGPSTILDKKLKELSKQLFQGLP